MSFLGQRARLVRAACLALFAVSATVAAQNAATEINIYGDAVNTVALEGYSGEAKRVLIFDLEIQGLPVVAKSEARYLLQGDNANGVQGRLVDGKTGETRLPGVRFSTSTTRRQAHALADYVVEGVTDQKGIALTRVAFKLSDGGNHWIAISDYDGHNPFKITRDTSLVASPSWSPDLKEIYYTSYRRNNPDVYRQNLNTGALQTVARYPGLNTGAVVSPDGRRVAMILSKAGSPDLYVADRDGANLTRLTTTDALESSPTWNPNGRELCLVSRRDGLSVLYKISASGGPLRRVPIAGASTCLEPDWSPDGRRIAFTAQRRSGFSICVVDADGGDFKEFTGVSGEDPSWAPNSRTLIFTSRRGRTRTLSLLDVDTEARKDVATYSGTRSQPSWAR